jgi:hypothetical protein
MTLVVVEVERLVVGLLGSVVVVVERRVVVRLLER